MSCSLSYIIGFIFGIFATISVLFTEDIVSWLFKIFKIKE